MRHRVQHILLVSNLYDSFILSEDGQLNEALLRQYIDLNLSNNPDLTRVSTGADALALALEQRRFELIVTRWRGLKTATSSLCPRSAFESSWKAKLSGALLSEVHFLQKHPEYSHALPVLVDVADSRAVTARRRCRDGAHSIRRDSLRRAHATTPAWRWRSPRTGR